MDDPEVILTWLGMSQYIDAFKKEAFDTWDAITCITERDLESLGVELGHRRLLQREIEKSRRTGQRPLYELKPIQQMPGDPSPPGSETGRRKKRGYKHHPKPDPNEPERPYTAYVLFSNHQRDALRAQQPNLSFSSLSKQVGERWQAISPAEKENWERMNAGPWEEYKMRLAEYRKTDQYREYQAYLAEFNAAQRAKETSGGKRSGHRRQASAKGPASAPSIASSPSMLQQSASPSQADDFQDDPGATLKRPKRGAQIRAEGGISQLQKGKRACESCRRRKIKCDGEHPMCQQCRDSTIECRYEDNKTASQRNIDSLARKAKTYEALLLKFLPQLDDNDRLAVQDAISLPPELDSSKDRYGDIKPESFSASTSDKGAESEASGVGSMGDTDRVDEEQFLQEGEAMAFEGRASDTTWLHRLRTELDQDPQTSKPALTRQKSILPLIPAPEALSKRIALNTEDKDMSIVGNQIYPLELPIRATADKLVEAYFSTIQPTFPVLNKPEFMSRYYEVYRAPNLASYRNRTFIASLQLVFGIAAVHAHLVKAEWAGDERDHMLYIASARILAVDSGVLNDLCYLDQVRVFALGALYLLTTDQINRCWNLTGMVIRAAQSMGLHLKNVTPSLGDAEKGQNARIWFAITSLESILTVVTSRPSMINVRDCSVSLLQALEDDDESSTQSTSPRKTAAADSSNPGSTSSSGPTSSESAAGRGSPSITSLYFKHYTDLCNLAKDVVGQLYCPGIRSKKWSDVQNIILTYDKTLFAWRDDLTPPFDAAVPPQDPETVSCSMALRILFYSTRIIINRPSLCRINDRLPSQSRSAKLTNHNFAKACVDSARAVVNLIVNTPQIAILRQGVTWWMVLHHLKRAAVVLLLELSYRAEHMPAEAGVILTEVKVAINWLRNIAANSPPAKATWTSLSRVLFQAAQRVGGDTSDIITDSPPSDPASTALFDGPLFGDMDLSGDGGGGGHAGSDNRILPGLKQQQRQQPQQQQQQQNLEQLPSAYDLTDPNVFPPLDMYSGFAQADWDEFGFEGLQSGAGGGGGGGGAGMDIDMGMSGLFEQEDGSGD